MAFPRRLVCTRFGLPRSSPRPYPARGYSGKEVGTEFPATYDPKQVEAGWYEWWERQGYFKPRSDDAPATSSAPAYTILLPPPNVTGSLHLGHALTAAVQDTLVRWRRMSGSNTLYLPGLDHAGIATQVVVERRLLAEEGKTRHDLGREAFVDKVWAWKEAYGAVICQQLKQTGASLDWPRLAFSMDEPRRRATTEAFVRLHEMGKISRDVRLVNWCCALRSAISDIEVDFVEIAKPTHVRVPGYEKAVEFGVLYEFAYAVEGSDDEVVVATTRPETVLGDTAVAVHPADPRYTHLHGRRLVCPFRPATIPVVTDATLVDMEVGTGAVKVTPGHDPDDFECGRRHALPLLSILTEDGRIGDHGGAFRGLKRFSCRRAVWQELGALGLQRGTRPHPMRLGVCSRTQDIIEPLLRPQWFVSCEEMARQAAQAVDDGELRLIPSTHNVTWKALP